MAIVQEAFDIPNEIMKKILEGDLTRLGGVVRLAYGPHKGQIFKHLDPVKLPEVKQAQNFAEKAWQLAKTNKMTLIIVSVLAGVGVGGYFLGKNHESKMVNELMASLSAYTNAIINGNLSLDEINNLMTSLEELKTQTNYGKISIKLSAEELSILVNRIYEYTLKLAQDNSIKLTPEECGFQASDDAIFNLQPYLKTQKEIFEEVA